MDNLIINKNEIIFERDEDLIRITPCAENSIRFEAFPGKKRIDENCTLMPKTADAVIEEKDYCVFMTVGSLKIQLERNGKVTFYKNGVSFLEERGELAAMSVVYHNTFNIASRGRR
jgi:hypothetical protein